MRQGQFFSRAQLIQGIACFQKNHANQWLADNGHIMRARKVLKVIVQVGKKAPS
jgi:hypothetical protein